MGEEERKRRACWWQREYVIKQANECLGRDVV